jgi:hypothetical protein
VDPGLGRDGLPRCDVGACLVAESGPHIGGAENVRLRPCSHKVLAPATVYAKLLDEGIYLGSVSTMYRVLRAHDEVHERRRQATHPAAKKPELLASKPNEVWSWDITKLLGPQK